MLRFMTGGIGVGGLSENMIYRSVIECYADTESVKDTAKATGVSEVKVRRILLTEGLWFSKTSLQVLYGRIQECGCPLFPGLSGTDPGDAEKSASQKTGDSRKGGMDDE